MLYSTTNNNNITLYGEDCLFVKAPSQGFIKILGQKAFLPKALFMHWWLFNLQRKSLLPSYLISVATKIWKYWFWYKTLDKCQIFKQNVWSSLKHWEPEIWSADRREGANETQEEKMDGEKLLESNAFWERKKLNLIQCKLHNPPDSSILISCRNDSNILYNQHQFQKNYNIFRGDFVVVPGHI